MGGHHITCKCGTTTRFRTDTCWIDNKGNIHDFEDWKCASCGTVFVKGEPNAQYESEALEADSRAANFDYEMGGAE